MNLKLLQLITNKPNLKILIQKLKKNQNLNLKKANQNNLKNNHKQNNYQKENKRKKVERRKKKK